jgi:hypothetical protein
LLVKKVFEGGKEDAELVEGTELTYEGNNCKELQHSFSLNIKYQNKSRRITRNLGISLQLKSGREPLQSLADCCLERYSLLVPYKSAVTTLEDVCVYGKGYYIELEGVMIEGVAGDRAVLSGDDGDE